MRQAARDVAQELQRALDHAARVARQAKDDLARLVGEPIANVRSRKAPDGPTDMIREIGRLRDEGLITEQEFQAKKADLLSRV